MPTATKTSKDAAAVPHGEILAAPGLWSSSWKLLSWNPSHLIGKRGIDVFDTMVRDDDQIKAAITFKREAVLATGWRVDPPETQPPTWEPVAFLRRRVGAMSVSLDRCMRDMLSATIYGFSLTEPIYERIVAGQDAGMIGLSALKTKAPHYLRFDLDDFANVIRIRNDQDGKDYDPAKFLLWSYNSQFGNPYGMSDLETCYRAYVLCNNSYKWLATYLEKLGVPPWFALYNPDALNGEGQQQALKDLIKNMQSSTAGIIPRPSKDDVELWTPNNVSNVQSVFIPALEHLKKDIARALLMPGLMGVTPDERSGSLARARVSLEMFLLHLTAVQGELAQVIQKGLIEPWTALNFDTNGEYPQFTFQPLNQEDAQAICTTWAAMVDRDIVSADADDEAHIRGLLKFPAREADDDEETPDEKDKPRIPLRYLEPLARAVKVDEVRAMLNLEPMGGEEGDETMAGPPPPEPPPPPAPGTAGPGTAAAPGGADGADAAVPKGPTAAKDNGTKPARQEPAKLRAKGPFRPFVDQGGAPTITPEDFAVSDEPLPPKPDDPGLTPAERRCDFAAIVDRLDSLDGGTTQALAALLRESLNAQIDGWMKKPPTLARVAKIQAAVPLQVRGLMQRNLKAAMTSGAKDCSAEARQVTAAKSFANELPNFDPKDAIAYLESKTDFLVTGLSGNLSNEVKQELLFGLRNGLPFTETRNRLLDRLSPWIGTPDADPKALNPARLLTTVRTNVTDAYNHGRLVEARRLGKKGFVKGMQHSSVLDSHTTAICKSLHGRCYRIDDPLLDRFTPPLHYRCRSILIPITLVDDVSDDPSDPNHWITPEEKAAAERAMPGDFGGSYIAKPSNPPPKATPPQPTAPPAPTGLLKLAADELARIKASGVNGQALDLDLGDLEDQAATIWQYEKNGKTFTAMQAKVRQDVARKLDAEWNRTLGGTGSSADVFDMGDQYDLGMNIYKMKAKTGASGFLQLEDDAEITGLKDKLAGIVGKLQAHLDAGEVDATKDIATWMDAATGVMAKLEKTLDSGDAANLKDLSFDEMSQMALTSHRKFPLTLKNPGATTAPEWSRYDQPFEIATFKDGRAIVTDKKMDQAYGRWIASDTDGVQARYHGSDEEAWALANTLRLDVEGDGADAAEKLARRLKDLGVDVRRTTADDREELYLTKVAYLHHTDANEWKAFQGKLGTMDQNGRLDDLRSFVRGAAGDDALIAPEHGGPGSAILYRPDLKGPEWDAFKDAHRLTHDNTGSMPMEDLVDIILTGGGRFAPTTDKLRRGIPLSGMSPEADIKTGGGAYFFTRIAPAENAVRRPNRFVFKADPLRRLDAISYDGDKFGRTTGDVVIQNRLRRLKEYSETAQINSYGNETIYRHEFDLLDNLDRIVVYNDQERDRVLATFHKHGIVALPDGRQIEAAVQVQQR